MTRDVPATAERTNIALDEAFLRGALRLAADDLDLDIGSRMRAAEQRHPNRQLRFTRGPRRRQREPAAYEATSAARRS